MVSKTTVVFAVLLVTIYVVQCAPAEQKKQDKKAVESKINDKQIKPEAKADIQETFKKGPKDVIAYAQKTFKDTSEKISTAVKGFFSSLLN